MFSPTKGVNLCKYAAFDKGVEPYGNCKVNGFLARSLPRRSRSPMLVESRLLTWFEQRYALAFFEPIVEDAHTGC